MAEITIMKGCMAQDFEEAPRRTSSTSHDTPTGSAVLRRFGRQEIVKEPVYDVKVLDKLVTRVAREIRLLEQALKATNAKPRSTTYDQDEQCWVNCRSAKIEWGGPDGACGLVGLVLATLKH